MPTIANESRVPGYCALCISRCGSVATLRDGRFVALDPDPSHPTGKALCIKGRVAPEIVYHSERLLHPLKRTAPKGSPDPGWRQISWEEALSIAGDALSRIASEHGPESVAFATASPSTSALSDSIDWVMRLRNAYGSPNFLVSMELCGWGRYLASGYTFGAAVPGAYMPDIANAGCILFWGYNPTVARIAHATETVAAMARGARLIVVDPRQAGLARRADQWLRVRPGTDGVLALAIAGVMIERGWFDEDFVRAWTNAPLLVRVDNGRFLRASDVSSDGNPNHYLAWNARRGHVVMHDPANATADHLELSLQGEHEVATLHGRVRCRPCLAILSEHCRQYDPASAQTTTGVPAETIERTARMLWECRPVAYYSWSGVEQHANSTQTARAINLLYALTGSLDLRGGNVLFPGVPMNPVAGDELLPDERRMKALGRETRPLGPSRFGFVTSGAFYRAALDGEPYRMRGLVGFGANLLIAHADGRRGRDALAALDFYVHADLFMNPTAELADIVLPAASAFETETLMPGFQVSAEAQSLVQLRRPLVAPRGQARSDMRIVFDLALHLGLGDHFWNGDTDAALRHQLAPSGLDLDSLRARPEGIRVPLAARYRKYAENGFNTPSRRVELYSETLMHHGHSPLPDCSEPALSPRSRRDLAHRFPLVLTTTKGSLYCESQHRNLPSLRRREPDPQIEMHPDDASRRGIGEGDWVRIRMPRGSVLARAKFNGSLETGVVCGQHGWWQSCPEIGAPAYPPFSEDGANLNLLFDHAVLDPISGGVPHRSQLCDITKAEHGPA